MAEKGSESWILRFQLPKVVVLKLSSFPIRSKKFPIKNNRKRGNVKIVVSETGGRCWLTSPNFLHFKKKSKSRSKKFPKKVWEKRKCKNNGGRQVLETGGRCWLTFPNFLHFKSWLCHILQIHFKQTVFFWNYIYCESLI